MGGGDARVELGGVEASLSRREDHLDVGIGRKGHEDEAEQGTQGELELLKLVRVARGARPASQAVLESLHDVGQALLTVAVRVAGGLFGLPRRDDQEGGAFVQENLLGLDGLAQGAELLLDDGQVGDQVVNDARPGLVEGLVPDGRRKGLDVEVGARVAGAGHVLQGLGRLDAHEAHAVVEDGLLFVGHDEVHLVHEDKDLGRGRVLRQGGHDGDVGGQVAVRVARLNVKDVNEHADRGKHVGALLVDVVFHKSFLSTAVPQVERQVAQEFDM